MYHLLVPFRNGIKDPVNRLWDLYKRHNRGGLLRIKAFTLEVVGAREIVLLTCAYAILEGVHWRFQDTEGSL